MIIRAFKESDLMNLYGTLSDPDVMNYIEPVFTLEKTRDFLFRAALSDSPLIYAAEDDNGKYIGYVIYHAYEHDSVELGWLLNKQEWGKGYASRLTELLINKAKQEGKNVVIECNPEQTVTKHIAEKNGFVYVGLRDGCDVYRLGSGEKMIEYKEFGLEEFERIKEIYRGESWNAYLHDDDALKRAFDNSLYCLGAYDGNKLIGFARCIGDGEHIVFVQDLIVAADYQRRKIGTTLFKRVWDKYIHVRMFQVNTDIEDERDNMFYRSFGMKPISEGKMVSYFRSWNSETIQIDWMLL